MRVLIIEGPREGEVVYASLHTFELIDPRPVGMAAYRPGEMTPAPVLTTTVYRVGEVLFEKGDNSGKGTKRVMVATLLGCDNAAVALSDYLNRQIQGEVVTP